QTHSARHAAARPDADAASASAPRPAAPGPDPTAGLQPALVLRRLSPALLERRGDLGGVRHRLPRSRGPGLRRLAAAADGGGYSHADGSRAVGPLRRGHAQSPARDPVALGQRAAVHRDGIGALCARAGAGADHHASVQPPEQRPRRGLREDDQTRLRGRRRAAGRGDGAGAAQRLDRGLQHPRATLGAWDAEPGRIPGGSDSKLLAVSRTLGSTPDAMQVSSSLWGGAYCPIIPVYKQMPRSWREGPIKAPAAKEVVLGYIYHFRYRLA